MDADSSYQEIGQQNHWRLGVGAIETSFVRGVCLSDRLPIAHKPIFTCLYTGISGPQQWGQSQSVS